MSLAARHADSDSDSGARHLASGQLEYVNMAHA